ncbi:MAG: excinuclease ABC subunit C [Gammaproteobacteria bacterium CG_4_10_14_0_8_um_filter_38_16]|nr:MAG: excinuclease ABC subunit C [Gammaproteobacteria bacterium CG_4_10_14_0_8_um_filter_38_16]PJA03737.1 MAG: excinuclease ABC subunit C [Gammaproteobacteria bacterium CG_4_10_14_0_2_um_filter_38_22]PJB10993.1 MAG: excinuclease ABC subunit C [Gammaproteobacteria bacterium CG_4_9_14_3_um_filter_38_9]
MINPAHKLKQLPNKPGVYQFLDEHKKILYVGKARNLKKRLAHYFRRKGADQKTNALMEKAADFLITITDNENQALLLECNLIKKHRPKYNILLRDDKSYPYLYLATQHPFPRLDYFRGTQKENGRYFGPYPNAGSVRENLAFLQKLFKLRQCSDVFFSHRSRPCLQYQINRCTAPCVNYVSKENYHQQVQDAIYFLEGKNNDVIRSVEMQMENAALNQDYESAAHWRDVLIRVRKLQAKQFITDGKGNVDIFGVAEKMGQIAIAVVSIRHGQLMGHKTFFPNAALEFTIEAVLSAFVSQYYFNPARESEKMDRVVLSHPITDRLWIQNALRETCYPTVIISDRKTPAFRQWISIATSNAVEALKQHQAEKNNMALKLAWLQKKCHLPALPEHIECFDISHTMGTVTKASCVVFGIEGAMKKAYRQFNISNITPGDDYAAMEQVLTRRYTKLKVDNQLLPDLIIVDGGKGQLKMAATVLESLQISGVMLMGIAKGEGRKPGLEKILIWGQESKVSLTPDDPVLHLLQFIRDEAHRFAITAHRKARGKKQLQSILDLIAGVGKKRKIDLLKHFGGLQELKKASTEEIAAVKGISRVLAKQIYDALHDQAF